MASAHIHIHVHVPRKRKTADAAIPIPAGKADRAIYKAALERRIKELEGGGVRGQQPRDLDDAKAQLKLLASDSAFSALEGKLAKQGVSDPGAVAYSIGVKKYGAAGMAAKAAAGRKTGDTSMQEFTSRVARAEANLREAKDEGNASLIARMQERLRDAKDDLEDAQKGLKRVTADSAYDAGLIGEEAGTKLGKPVNEEWLRLDRMTPDMLAATAKDKGIKAEDKTDIVMALLRAKFSAAQLEAWGLYY